MELAIHAVSFFSGKPRVTKTKLRRPEAGRIGSPDASIVKRLQMREVYMKTLVIGLVIAIVYLTTYFVQTMEHIW